MESKEQSIVSASAYLLYMRKSHKMSQYELAKLCHKGQTYISDIETGRRSGNTVKTLMDIADAMNMNYEDFFSGLGKYLDDEKKGKVWMP